MRERQEDKKILSLERHGRWKKKYTKQVVGMFQSLSYRQGHCVLRKRKIMYRDVKLGQWWCKRQISRCKNRLKCKETTEEMEGKCRTQNEGWKKRLIKLMLWLKAQMEIGKIKMEMTLDTIGIGWEKRGKRTSMGRITRAEQMKKIKRWCTDWGLRDEYARRKKGAECANSGKRKIWDDGTMNGKHEVLKAEDSKIGQTVTMTEVMAGEEMDAQTNSERSQNQWMCTRVGTWVGQTVQEGHVVNDDAAERQDEMLNTRTAIGVGQDGCAGIKTIEKVMVWREGYAKGSEQICRTSKSASSFARTARWRKISAAPRFRRGLG